MPSEATRPWVHGSLACPKAVADSSMAVRVPAIGVHKPAMSRIERHALKTRVAVCQAGTSAVS